MFGYTPLSFFHLHLYYLVVFNCIHMYLGLLLLYLVVAISPPNMPEIIANQAKRPQHHGKDQSATYVHSIGVGQSLESLKGVVNKFIHAVALTLKQHL